MFGTVAVYISSTLLNILVHRYMFMPLTAARQYVKDTFYLKTEQMHRSLSRMLVVSAGRSSWPPGNTAWEWLSAKAWGDAIRLLPLGQHSQVGNACVQEPEWMDQLFPAATQSAERKESIATGFQQTVARQLAPGGSGELGKEELLYFHHVLQSAAAMQGPLQRMLY